MSSDGKEQNVTEVEEALTALLRGMGQAINLQTLYGPNHKLASEAVAASAGHLETAFKRCSKIDLSVEDNLLLVNGHAADMNNPFIGTLAMRLAGTPGAAISLNRGFTEDDLTELIAALRTGKVEEKLREGGLRHVSSEQISYQRIRSGQRVVSERDSDSFNDAAAAFDAALRSGASADGNDNQGGAGRTETVTEILAFLKGEVSTPSEKVAAHLGGMATDADKLAELVLQAATVRQSSVSGGESLSDIVVGCLRKVVSGLAANPSAKTEQGARDFKKTLMLLEKSVLQRLQQMSGSRNLAAEQAVISATAEMVNEVEITRMTENFLEQRKRMDQSTKQLQSYLARKGTTTPTGQAVRQNLIEGGLNPGEWHQLTLHAAAGSGTGASGTNLSSEGPGLGALAMLLSQLDKLMDEEAGLKQTTQSVQKHTEKVVESATSRIEELGKNPDDSQQKMLEKIAELVQELAQPLTAVNCAVDMTLSERLGPLSDPQKELLNLAASSGIQLHGLFQKLIAISGLPKGLLPNKELIYGPAAQQS